MLPSHKGSSGVGSLQHKSGHRSGNSQARTRRVRNARSAGQAPRTRQDQSEPAALSAAGARRPSAAQVSHLLSISSGNVSHVCRHPGPRHRRLLLRSIVRSTVARSDTLPSRADQTAAAAVRRRHAWRVKASADRDAATGDAAERSASADGTQPASEGGPSRNAASGDEGAGRRPGGRSRGQPGLHVRWPGFGGDTDGGIGSRSGDYGQSSWAKMMLSLPLEVAAAASRSDSHYLQKRKRKHWWSAESFPRVCARSSCSAGSLSPATSHGPVPSRSG